MSKRKKNQLLGKCSPVISPKFFSCSFFFSSSGTPIIQISLSLVRESTVYCLAFFNPVLWKILPERRSGDIFAAAAAAKSLQSCPTLRDPIDGSPPGSRPWDSPGKNTGVGCHFLLQCMKVKSESEVAQSCLTLSDPRGLQPSRLLCPWDFPGKSTGVGCHCLLR